MNNEPSSREEKLMEDAFVMADSHYFEPAATSSNPDGQLEPFSSRRKRAAGALGMKMFFNMSDGDQAQMEDNGSYPGMDQDVAILLWVCLQDPKRLQKALRFPDRALDELNDWADTMEMAAGEPNQMVAVSCFTNLVLEVVNSTPGFEDDGKENESTKKPSVGMPDGKSSYQNQQDTPSIKLDGAFPLPEE